MGIFIRVTAINAIKDVVNAPDFDRRMLILATQITHRSDNRRVLIVVLECLLKSLKVGSGSEAVPETMTLLRCIIKLILGSLAQPVTKRWVSLTCSVVVLTTSLLLYRDELIDNVIYHFRTGELQRVYQKLDFWTRGSYSTDSSRSLCHPGPEGNFADLQGLIVAMANCL